MPNAQNQYPNKNKTTTQKGIELIKYFEGFSSTTYICSAGRNTIGYGHLIKENEDFPQGITKQEAENILKSDIQIAESGVIELITVSLTDYQFDALVSFTYNLGVTALKNSTLREKLNKGLYSEVPSEMIRWVHAKGKKLQGLVLRREAESILFSTGKGINEN